PAPELDCDRSRRDRATGTASCRPAPPGKRCRNWRERLPLWPAAATQGGGANHDTRLPATKFTASARMNVLKKKLRTPCASTIRRMVRDVTCTSETWHVMPTT